MLIRDHLVWHGAIEQKQSHLPHWKLDDWGVANLGWDPGYEDTTPYICIFLGAMGHPLVYGRGAHPFHVSGARPTPLSWFQLEALDGYNSTIFAYGSILMAARERMFLLIDMI